MNDDVCKRKKGEAILHAVYVTFKARSNTELNKSYRENSHEQEGYRRGADKYWR